MAVELLEHLPAVASLEPEQLEIEHSAEEIEIARALLSLHPNLREWALQEYTYGFLDKNDLYSNKRIVQLKETRNTAWHEMGHKLVAERHNWTVDKVSVIQNGNTLGYTISRPPADKPIESLLLDRIAISFGGWAAEEMNDHDHKGCGSDIATALYFADVVTKLNPHMQASALNVIQRQKARAMEIVRSYGATNMEDRSRYLQKKRVL